MNLDQMSPEKLNDIKAEIHERFPNVDWPELTQERVTVMGYDIPIPGVYSNSILEKVEETDEYYDDAVKYFDGKLPRHVAFCSDQYNFIPYEVATKEFLNFVDSYDQWGKPKINIHIFNGGSRMKAEAVFNEHVETLKSTVEKGKDIAPVGGFYHGIGLDWVFRVWAGALRLICTNGMVGHHLNIELRKKHKSTLDIGEMIGALAPTFDKYSEQIAIWSQWGEIDISEPTVEDLLAASGFGTKHQEEILALPETSTGETLEEWLRGGKVNVLNLYNVLTQFTTHEIDSDMVRVRRGEDIAKAFETFNFKKAA